MWANSKKIAIPNKKERLFKNSSFWILIMKPKKLKYIKNNKWFKEVPIGLEIKSGWWPKLLYKKYPTKLPGNKYSINKTKSEK